MAVSQLPNLAKWGTNQKSGASSYGILVSYEEIDELMTQTETDEDGAVCRVVPYDKRYRTVFAVQAGPTTQKPAVGVEITVEGRKGWVQHSEVIEQNKAFKKIRVTMESYQKCDTLG